jgi:hypothetical protein
MEKFKDFINSFDFKEKFINSAENVIKIISLLDLSNANGAS